jgi:hypothetical protein
MHQLVLRWLMVMSQLGNIAAMYVRATGKQRQYAAPLDLSVVF